MWISGKELPPFADGGLSRLKIEDTGKFTTGEIPLKTWRFVIRQWPKPSLQSNALNFLKPGTHEVELIYDASKPSLSARLLNGP